MIQLSDYEAVIFDMDGVITDSEPIWKIAMEEVFHHVGCDLTRNDFQKTVGLRIDEVVRYWHSLRPWPTYSCSQVETMIVDRMEELLRAQATPLPGIVESLNYFREQGLKIGLATSSYKRLIKAILETIGITDLFDQVHSAEDEAYGKPHPAVYLTTAQRLGVSPMKCLVIEDSLNGVIAGKAARMKVVCIPEKTHTPEPKLIVADFHFETCTDVLNELQKA